MPKFEREVEIDAPIEKVWQVLIDPNHWPQWFPGVDGVSNVTSVSEGGRFQWTDDDREGQGTITTMEPTRRLKIVTQMGNDQDAHLFELRSSGGFLGLSDDECKIKYTLDTLTGGGILGRFVAGGNPRDMLRVKKAMHSFRRLVESL
jgi:uncharacterized protein YndB with AHSA1/START domain